MNGRVLARADGEQHREELSPTFANPDLYDYLESEGYLYAIRLPAIDVLRREIVPFLKRPVGRPPN